MRIFWSYTTQTNLARKKNLIQQNEALKKSKSTKITVRIKMLITATPLTITGTTTTVTTIKQFSILV